MSQIPRWRIVRYEELTYLRGVARSVAKMQRSATRQRDYVERLEQKSARLKGQIRSDQKYIDLLEERVSAKALKEARLLMAKERA